MTLSDVSMIGSKFLSLSFFAGVMLAFVFAAVKGWSFGDQRLGWSQIELSTSDIDGGDTDFHQLPQMDAFAGPFANNGLGAVVVFPFVQTQVARLSRPSS